MCLSLSIPYPCQRAPFLVMGVLVFFALVRWFRLEINRFESIENTILEGLFKASNGLHLLAET